MNTLARSPRQRCTRPQPTSAAATPPPISHARRLSASGDVAFPRVSWLFTVAILSRPKPEEPAYAARRHVFSRGRPPPLATHRLQVSPPPAHVGQAAPSQAKGASFLLRGCAAASRSI